MEHKIAVLPGDGIGEEVMEQALRVLTVISEKSGRNFVTKQGYIGGAAWEKFGKHFPEETKELCENSEAILFGSVGGPVSEQHLDKWRNCEREALLGIRKAFNFNANFRPVKVFPSLSDICPLKKEVVQKGLDILFIRELIGDIYFGEHKTFIKEGRRVATDVAEYNEDQIASIARVAFDAAKKRNKKVTSVDKANVLDTSKLWRTVVREVAKGYPDIELKDMLVDNCAMQIIINPSQFDVIVTSNLFGDILSDAGAVLPGSLGLMPSASFNQNGFAMYEPIGGSAPDIAGKNIANPIAQILSAALMLRYSFKMEQEARLIENSIEKVLNQGFRSKDIYQEGNILVGTKELSEQIISNLN